MALSLMKDIGSSYTKFSDLCLTVISNEKKLN